MLGLDKMAESFSSYTEEIEKQPMSLTEALLLMTEKELEYRQENKIGRLIRNANFPVIKKIDNFDFSFQPSINKAEILDLTNMGYMESFQNVCFIGNSGVGKSHISIGLGVEACRQGINTRFVVFHHMMNKLSEANRKGTLSLMLTKLSNIPLLIIDEIGYVPITKEQADWFYQLISGRYEKHSTIITTNTPFSMWAKIFNNDTAAAAILDRLIHHSKIFKITGNSYRLKDYHDAKVENASANRTAIDEKKKCVG